MSFIKPFVANSNPEDPQNSTGGDLAKAVNSLAGMTRICPPVTPRMPDDDLIMLARTLVYSAPTITPQHIGAFKIDKLTGLKYVAVGTTSATDWSQL